MTLPVITVQTAVVGSGAASLNAAVHLNRLGNEDVLIVTDGMGGGTSNNTGSDKQTYYKLSLYGDGADCPHEMAHSLFDGGAMHGDIALIEAQLSANSFYNLVNLGVAFPHDTYGGFVGYKTDHDPRQRATSAGPKTSMLMFQALAAEVKRRNIAIQDCTQVISLITDGDGTEKRVIGMVCLELDKLEEENFGLLIINTENVVYGTGGPAILYADSVYPQVHTGATGIALEAGAIAQNCTEWQYGIASKGFRWNLSGTYQQVLPRYISTNQDGSDEREFLSDYIKSTEKLLECIFLKGYQWPFDPRKIKNFGSSIVDLLVYYEIAVKNRRVYMDFLHNPLMMPRIDESMMVPEVYEYLKKSNAMQDLPIERLAHMNMPAIELYQENGIDLFKEPLEIAVSAQHNNGGLKGNIWWESNLRHLFPVGEVNGSHGVYRPGGSALNSGQCGSLRAAQYINARYNSAPQSEKDFSTKAESQILMKIDEIHKLLNAKTCNIIKYRTELQHEMSRLGAYVRSAENSDELLKFINEKLQEWENIGIDNPTGLPYAFKNKCAVTTALVYVSAFKEYIGKGGVSRGSYLIANAAGEPVFEGKDDKFIFDADKMTEVICESKLNADNTVEHKWVERRQIPPADAWYETAWAKYRNGEIFD